MNTRRLSRKQKRSIRQATRRINLWHGAVRSGKTFASLLAWLDFVATAPPGALVMIGKTKETLERNILDPLMEPELWAPHPCPIKHTRGANVAWIFGRLVYVVGANDAKAEGRIRGMTLIGAYVDEVSLLPGEGYWNQLLARLSLDGARLFGTTNPDSPLHWLKRNVIDRADELDLACWHFTLLDNPSLSARFKAQLIAENVGLWRKRFIDGLWVLAEGAIYDTFDVDDARLVLRADPDWGAVVEWIVAVDYGTTNPFVALLIAVMPDRLVVAREWRHDSKQAGRQLTDAEYSTELRKWLEALDPADNEKRPGRLAGCRTPSRIAVDPSASSLIQQLYRDGWLGVVQADNAVADGIRAVASLGGSGRLQVVAGQTATSTAAGSGCDSHITEKASYVWDATAAAKGVEQPMKVGDHGPDAERYGVAACRRHWRHWVSLPVPEDEAA